MTIEEIKNTGFYASAQRGGEGARKYAVKITVNKNEDVAMYFDLCMKALFKKKNVVPIFCGDRLYFLTDEEAGAKGFAASDTAGGKTLKLQLGKRKELFKDFVGTYKVVEMDTEAGRPFITKAMKEG